MISIKKPNGYAIDPQEPITPQDETGGVGQNGANIDMAPTRDSSEIMRATVAMETSARNMETAVTALMQSRRSGLERWAPWATIALVILGWAGSGLLTAKNSESDLRVQIAVLAEQLKEWKEQSLRTATEQARVYDRDNKVNEERWNEIKIVLRARGIKVPN